MHLEHVNLTVSNLERSLDFYGRLLDLRVRWRGTTSEGRPAAHIGHDDFYLALFEASPDATGGAVIDYAAVGLNHVGFVVDDLGAATDRLAALGVRPTQEADYDPGRRLYFLDPDGIEIELVSYASAPSG
ncbi:MAG: VOC family protein [Planctomycetota bacterium]|jgi:catechol 2,3-dioxygenase-like lactoylglutathione lyase family enzyme